MKKNHNNDWFVLYTKNQDVRIIVLKGKNCIARLQMLGATISFQLN